MPDTVLSVWSAETHFIFPATLRCGCSYFHLTDEDPAAPRLTNKLKGTASRVVEPRFKPSSALLPESRRLTPPQLVVGPMACQKHGPHSDTKDRSGSCGEKECESGQIWGSHPDQALMQASWDRILYLDCPASTMTLQGKLEGIKQKRGRREQWAAPNYYAIEHLAN